MQSLFFLLPYTCCVTIQRPKAVVVNVSDVTRATALSKEISTSHSKEDLNMKTQGELRNGIFFDLHEQHSRSQAEHQSNNPDKTAHPDHDQKHVQKDNRKNVAVAWGGGGCYSAVSQLGFVRGLLAANYAQGPQVGVAASCSGGSWAAGMFFATGGRSFWKGHTSKNSTLYERLGKWCMYKPLRDGIDRDKWAVELTACGKCAKTRSTCKNEEIQNLFGMAASCINPNLYFNSNIEGVINYIGNLIGGAKNMGTTMLEMSSEAVKSLKLTMRGDAKAPVLSKNEPSSFIEISSAMETNSTSNKINNFLQMVPITRQMYEKLQMLQQWMQFWRPIGVPMRAKLRHINFENKYQFELLWAEIDGKPPPWRAQAVLPVRAGPKVNNQISIVEATAKSSDFLSWIGSQKFIQTHIAQNCEFWSTTIEEQTKNKQLPYPFSYVKDIPGFSWLKAWWRLWESSGSKKPQMALFTEIGHVVNEGVSLLQEMTDKNMEKMTEQDIGTTLRDLFLLQLTAKAFPLMGYGNLPEFFDTWAVDGALADIHAVAPTVHLMDDITAEERPKVLVGMITGALTNDPYSTVGSLLRYFLSHQPYGKIWPDLSGLFAKDSFTHHGCKLGEQEVLNPLHLFEYKCSAGDGIGEDTTNEKDSCNDLMMQLNETGSVFVQDTRVVPNKYWEVKGGWTTNVVFSLLAKNHISEMWVHDVWSNDPEEMERLKHFPVFPNPARQMAGMRARDGFALMNYNAYKGYLIACALIFYTSGGICEYCQKNTEFCVHALRNAKPKHGFAKLVYKN